MPQRSASKSGHDDEEIEDSASSDSSFSSSTPQSKLNLPDISTGSFSSVAIPVMTKNALAMEEQLAILTKMLRHYAKRCKTMMSKWCP